VVGGLAHLYFRTNQKRCTERSACVPATMLNGGRNAGPLVGASAGTSTEGSLRLRPCVASVSFDTTSSGNVYTCSPSLRSLSSSALRCRISSSSRQSACISCLSVRRVSVHFRVSGTHNHDQTGSVGKLRRAGTKRTLKCTEPKVVKTIEQRTSQ
jgi:hypothetical protein